MLRAMVLGLVMGLMLGPGAPTLAVNWNLVGDKNQGQEQQYIDLDSLQVWGSGIVRVKSYYLDQRFKPAQRTNYVTDYNCQTQEFRDVNLTDQGRSSPWLPVGADPLNAAAMDSACAMSRVKAADSAP